MRWLVVTIISVGCSSVTPVQPDAGSGGDSAVDTGGDAAVDAAACAAAMPIAKTITLTSVTPTALVLDGNGSRCEQLARAIIDPAQRPPELAELDATMGVDSPLCVSGSSYDLVRIDITMLAGHRLLSGGEWLRARVRDDNTLDQLDGWFVTVPQDVPTGCAGDGQLRDGVVHYIQPFQTFEFCTPTGGGKWEVSADDTRTLGETGWFYDGTYLRAARFVDVHVAVGAITPELRASDLACDSNDVGLTFIVDANTGAVLDTRRHCIVC